MKPIIFYLLVWVFLSVIWFFSSEAIVNWVLPGTHNVNAWLMTVAIGVVLLFIILSAVYLVIFSRRRRS